MFYRARGPVKGSPSVLAKLQQKKLILSVLSFAALLGLEPLPPLAIDDYKKHLASAKEEN